MNLESVFANSGVVLPINASFSLDDDLLFPEPVQVHGEVRNRSGVVTLQASFSTHLCFDCDRCAEFSTCEYSGTVFQTLVRELNGDESDEFTLLPDAQLDLTEAVREELYLQLPSKLLCTPDCRGLCLGCGANLNHTICTCK
ncbi:MAG: DUF177 domain-containing protein, partial [Oscillospiraceae bacterium]|nr:DUF177 domain-containing protein [Oscillospiraceae bacterium]